MGMVVVIGTVCIALAGAALIGLMTFGIVSFEYWRPYENQPLRHPVRVASLSTDELVLADSTRYALDLSDDFKLALAVYPPHSANQVTAFLATEIDEVELRSHPTGPGLQVLYKEKWLFCDGPIITIPLIPRDFPRYEVGLLGTATQVEENAGSRPMDADP